MFVLALEKRAKIMVVQELIVLGVALTITKMLHVLAYFQLILAPVQGMRVVQKLIVIGAAKIV